MSGGTGRGLEVRLLAPEEVRARIVELAAILVDCVEGGAQVSFMLPFGQRDAEAFFEGMAASAARSERAIFAAFVDGALVGTAQLVTQTPPNQPHRADVAKMLVHRAARGRGVGAALLGAMEARAREIGRTLLVLDTASGSAGERLYARAGWTRVGVIPGFALDPDDRRPRGCTIFYKTP